MSDAKYIDSDIPGYSPTGVYTSITIGPAGHIGGDGFVGGTRSSYGILNLGQIGGVFRGASGITLQLGGTIVNGSTSNTTALIGGHQGSANSTGGVGISISGGTASIGNYGAISGGPGGFGGKGSYAANGGDGGIGVQLSLGGSLSNAGTISGGVGGVGGTPTAWGANGYAGGAGAAGISLSASATITNLGLITGGQGGAGGAGSSTHIAGYIGNGGKGGDGAAGIVLSAGGSIGNLGTITGGQGGEGGTDLFLNRAASGASGNGILLSVGGIATNGDANNRAAEIQGKVGILSSDAAATITNFGTITGLSGYGVNAGGTVIDSGTISGSRGAVRFAGTGTHSLVLESGFHLDGKVVGTGAHNTLELAGSVGSGITASYNGLKLSNFQDVLFGPGGNATLDVSNTTGTLGVTLSDLDQESERIDLTALGAPVGYALAATQLTVTGENGSVTFNLDASDAGKFALAPDGSNGMIVEAACLRRGTRILTGGGRCRSRRLRSAIG